MFRTVRNLLPMFLAMALSLALALPEAALAAKKRPAPKRAAAAKTVAAPSAVELPQLTGEGPHLVRLKNGLSVLIKRDDRFDLTICNPPFHGSASEADAAARRKVANLTGQRMGNVELNFVGRHHELWCDGGEEVFLATMARESVSYGHQVAWFSSLVSKAANVRGLQRELEMCDARRVVTLDMAQGNKISRVVAWTYLDKEEMAIWREARWGQ